MTIQNPKLGVDFLHGKFDGCAYLYSAKSKKEVLLAIKHRAVSWESYGFFVSEEFFWKYDPSPNFHGHPSLPVGTFDVLTPAVNCSCLHVEVIVIYLMRSCFFGPPFIWTFWRFLNSPFLYLMSCNIRWTGPQMTSSFRVQAPPSTLWLLCAFSVLLEAETGSKKQ